MMSMIMNRNSSVNRIRASRQWLAGIGMAGALACTGSTPAKSARLADSAFASLQARGQAAMGVDQYTSSHVFESLPDGGRIVLQRDSVDTAGTAVIRRHLGDIAERFSAGDFSIPGMVHSQEVPGSREMAARRAMISYAADTLTRGGAVRITSTDSTAIAAIHAFVAFQRMDHRAAGHMR
ncbi:MAG: hypothetical protein ABIS03_00060 [Gemmatimonadaceae bacterium]